MATQPNGTATDLARTVVADTVEYLFEQYPHVARRAGRHDFDGRLPDVSTRSPSDLDRMRAAAERELSVLLRSADPELRADLGTAVKVLHGDRFQVAELGKAHPGPSDWLSATEVAVAAACEDFALAVAVDRAMVLCGWSAERAAREVLVVTSNAVGAMYTLGRLRIRDWRDTVRTTSGRKDFHDRLLACGGAPLSVARQYLDARGEPAHVRASA